MEYREVQSSTVHTVGYDVGRQVLEVTFNSGATYQYTGVPKEVADEFLNAKSKGSYFAVNIRANYPCERLHLETCGKYLECLTPNCACWCHKMRKDVSNAESRKDTTPERENPPAPTRPASKKKAKKGRQAI